MSIKSHSSTTNPSSVVWERQSAFWYDIQSTCWENIGIDAQRCLELFWYSVEWSFRGDASLVLLAVRVCVGLSVSVHAYNAWASAWAYFHAHVSHASSLCSKPCRRTESLLLWETVAIGSQRGKNRSRLHHIYLQKTHPNPFLHCGGWTHTHTVHGVWGNVVHNHILFSSKE